MGNGRTDDATHRFLAIKTGEKLYHLLFYAIWRWSNIVNLLASKHPTDNMLLVCTVLTYFYLPSITIAKQICKLSQIMQFLVNNRRKLSSED